MIFLKKRFLKTSTAQHRNLRAQRDFYANRLSVQLTRNIRFTWINLRRISLKQIYCPSLRFIGNLSINFARTLQLSWNNELCVFELQISYYEIAYLHNKQRSCLTISTNNYLEMTFHVEMHLFASQERCDSP